MKSSTSRLIAISLPFLLGAAAPASASILLLDFGPTTPTAGNLTNSPFHSSELATSASSWNVLGTADSSSLSWGDGTTATGVAIDLGRGVGSSTIDFAGQPGSSSALGGIANFNQGVFAGDSVGKDGIFQGANGNNNPIGLKVTGLTAGLYEVFVVGVNTSANPMYSMNIGALATTNVGTLDIAALSAVTVANTNTVSANASWLEEGNFARFTVTLSEANPVLTIFTGAAAANNRGFLNTVQIVAIPEPSTYAALFGLLALGFVAWRRRR